MALTLNLDRPTASPLSDGWAFFSGSIDLDSSYPTGGYSPPTKGNFRTKFKTLKGVYFESQQGRTVEWNKRTNKIQVWVSAGMEVPNGTDLSYMTKIQFFAWGIGMRR